MILSSESLRILMAAYDFILPLKHVFRNTLPLWDVGLSDSFSYLMLTAADKVHRPLWAFVFVCRLARTDLHASVAPPGIENTKHK